MAPPVSTAELRAKLRFDEVARERAARDFGGVIHELPAAVLIAESPDDVVAAVRWAADQGLKVAPRGRGHATFGRSQAPGGLVVDVSALDGVGTIEEDRVRVQAGATWRDVLAASLARDKGPPVLTDYLDLSVGGTLILGGIGAATLVDGVQSDHVLSLELVTGKGEVLTCSADHCPELFDAVRGGLGKVGVITAATLALTEAPRNVRRFLLWYRDLAAMLAEARRLVRAGRFDAVQGAIFSSPDDGRLVFRLEVAKYFDAVPPGDAELLAGLADDSGRREASTLSFWDYATRLAALEAALRAEGHWELPHPWLTTFIGDSAVELAVGRELEALDPTRDLGPLGQVVLSPIQPATVRTPLLRLPADDLCWAFNLIRLPASANHGVASHLVEANEAAYTRIREAGGTLYPASAFELPPNGWCEHFGPLFARLEAAKERFDPSGILTPGYGVF